MKVFLKIPETVGSYKKVDIKNAIIQLILDYVLQYKHDFKNSFDSCWRRESQDTIYLPTSIHNIMVPTCWIKQQQRYTSNVMQASQLFARFISQPHYDNETNAKIIEKN